MTRSIPTINDAGSKNLTTHLSNVTINIETALEKPITNPIIIEMMPITKKSL